jgi:predicted acyltransferase (DUF342 family)
MDLADKRCKLFGRLVKTTTNMVQFLVTYMRAYCRQGEGSKVQNTLEPSTSPVIIADNRTKNQHNNKKDGSPERQ